MRKRFFAAVALGIMLLSLCGCGKAEEYYESGLVAAKEADYETALLYFSKALDENPNKAEYYLEQGYAYAALGRYEEARTAFEAAVVEQNLELTRKNNKRAWRAIGIAYYEEGKYAEAKTYFEKALEEELLPELSADVRMYLADALECEGDFDAAIAMYDTLLAEKTDYAAGYRARAYMSYVQGNYEKSLADYDAAIALTPEDFDLYFGKYNVLEKLGKPSEQAALLRVITTIENPTEEDSYYIAKAQFFSGEYESALVSLAEAAKNGYDDSHYYIGEIYHARSAYGEAVYHYKQYIAGSGAKDAAAYNQMGICLMKQAQYADALEAVRAGQKFSDPLHEKQLFFNEVVILEKMGEYNTAYEKALEYRSLYPEDTRIRRELDFLATRVREET
ncbi:MAG: tetratricopeptide repeat protein [Lachnospiraceae bacterium]|nr:tetratricopeptide repeat protein [Lachnospiraceae bacterium]